jgi:hypothetical protein
VRLEHVYSFNAPLLRFAGSIFVHLDLGKGHILILTAFLRLKDNLINPFSWKLLSLEHGLLG